MRPLNAARHAVFVAASGAVLVLAAAGCRERPRAAAPPAVGPVDDGGALDPDARLDALEGQYLNDTAAASPVEATWLGIHGWDDRLDDASAAAQARDAARLRHTLERLDEIPALALDARHRLDRTLLEHHARLALFELTEVRALEHNPIRYVSIVSGGIYELLAGEFNPLPERVRAMVGRLSRVRSLFDEARKNLRNPSELQTRRGLELAQSTRGFLGETLPRLVSSVADDRLLADFRTAHGDALRACDDFINFLQKDLLARSHGEISLGRERLLERLRLREAIEAAPEALLAQLVAAGERELKAAEKRFEESARQVAPGKSPPEALRILDEDHPSAEQLLPTVQQSVDQLWAFVRGRQLLELSVDPPRAQPMPPYLWGYALLDAAGPFEPAASFALYVDPVNPSWDRKTREEHLRAFGRASVELFAVHQPLAHVVQAEAVRRAPSTMQRLGLATAFTEGFPRYLEQILLDEGFGGGDPRLRLAQRREALVALCRFMAALRVHGQGARIEDVVKLFTDGAWMEEGVARREAERVAADPMVLDEAFGLLALLRLRDDVAKERGASFSLRKFHDELLAHGALPIGLLRTQLLQHDTGPIL